MTKEELAKVLNVRLNSALDWNKQYPSEQYEGRIKELRWLMKWFGIEHNPNQK